MVYFYLYSVGAIVIIVATLLPTLIVEFPFVYWGITKKFGFFVALNVMTNMLFNSILFVIARLNFKFNLNWLLIVWFVSAELIIIPLGEAYAYKKITETSIKRIILFSYLANITSCLVGLLPQIIIYMRYMR